jgi:hypothetical protein
MSLHSKPLITPETFLENLPFPTTELGISIQQLEFPRGILGFESHTLFEVSPLGFLVKISCDHPFYIRFYGLPMGLIPQQIYDKDDLHNALSLYQLDPDNTIIMPFIAGDDANGALELRANLKAPIIIDVETRRAWQHVFAPDRYPLRLSLGDVPHLMSLETRLTDGY